MRAWLNSQKEKMRRLYWILKKGFPLRLWLCDVDPARIPASTIFPHPIGIVIARDVILGDRCMIYQNVTLGTGPCDSHGPRLGDKVTVYPGAMVIGARNIGHGAQIGAGCHVYRDVAICEIVRGQPD
jgi:serine acetyltransferase